MNTPPVSNLNGPITHRIEAAEAGLTLGELAERLAGASGAAAVERGGAWLDGRRALDPALRLPVGATLTLHLPPTGRYPEVWIEPTDIAWEDPWLIALHKRAGWYVGATPWDIHGNVLAALGRYLANRDGSTPPLHLAHQLDRDTSGILLVSKTPEANAALQAAFAEGRVSKTYFCLCTGQPAWRRLELHTGHGRAAGGRWRVYPLDMVGQTLPAGGGRVREARTTLYVTRTLPDAALIVAIPHTGRTHQIRLHLAYAGHPLLGDTRYGGPSHYAGMTLPGHLLHAAELRFTHPITGAPVVLASPLPPIFARLLG